MIQGIEPDFQSRSYNLCFHSEGNDLYGNFEGVLFTYLVRSGIVSSLARGCKMYRWQTLQRDEKEWKWKSGKYRVFITEIVIWQVIHWVCTYKKIDTTLTLCSLCAWVYAQTSNIYTFNCRIFTYLFELFKNPPLIVHITVNTIKKHFLEGKVPAFFYLFTQTNLSSKNSQKRSATGLGFIFI